MLFYPSIATGDSALLQHRLRLAELNSMEGEAVRTVSGLDQLEDNPRRCKTQQPVQPGQLERNSSDHYNRKKQ